MKEKFIKHVNKERSLDNTAHRLIEYGSSIVSKNVCIYCLL